MSEPAIRPPRSADGRLERRRAQREARRTAARRRLALAALAAVAAIAGAIVGAVTGDDDGSGSDGGGGAADGEAVAPKPSCPPEIASAPRRLAGQMTVVRMEATATDALRRVARRGELGGVVLFPPAGTRPGALRAEIEALRDAAAQSGGPPPLVMIDQEGGEVKRLPSLPPVRSPAELGAAAEAAGLEAGRATGAALAALGIDVDLAPVLDVGATDSFIATRAFGSDPAAVAASGVAFGEGLQAGGVAATAKHFPGLGEATVNTDLAPSPVEATRAQLERGLEPFRAAIEAGLDLVMVANATYPAYDAERPASLSPRVVQGLLRERLGFDGVVITDDLGAQALVQAGIDESEAAVAAARAGNDLVLFALTEGEAARTSLTRALRRGDLDRRAALESCARVLALRTRLAGG